MSPVRMQRDSELLQRGRRMVVDGQGSAAIGDRGRRVPCSEATTASAVSDATDSGASSSARANAVSSGVEPAALEGGPARG